MNAAFATVQVLWSRILRRLNEAMEARARTTQSLVLPEPPVDAKPPAAPPDAPKSHAAWDRARLRWWRYRQPTTAFAIALGVVGLFGAWALRPTYDAYSVLSLDSEARNDWERMLEEGSEADLEEQLRSRTVLEAAVRSLGLFPVPTRRGWLQSSGKAAGDPRSLQRVLDRFRARLGIERLRRSTMLRVSIKDTDPSRAAASANAVAKAFIEFRRRRALEDVERRLSAMDQEIAGVQSELDMLTVLRSEVLVDDSLLQELVRQLASADTRLSQTMSRYKPGSPTVEQARREKDQMERILRERITERRLQLQDRLQQHEQVATNEPAAVTMDAAIEQVTARYRELLNQRAETHLTFTLWQQPSDSFGKFAILDPALPPPARSRLGLILWALIQAALLACASLLLIPLALERWDARAQRPGSLAHRMQRTWATWRPSRDDPSPTEPIA